uniref:Holocytochrome c-type synthase n=1 Tax=Craspedostauros australis TaxID=1486917 RepID=A0A7R9WWQ5_9STRA|mmetsp:Transcript_23410/g.65327  ORF Transcript_23410/g.65327 Transcript_23410/m.65327 type:complete len:296 (+) Transcript_23410:140-1027(+)|eukprot:CAMPEP_0198121558 /NCGR_PEP_ID=MMETSP1442-20131203/32445_1 /TAXON_ID= /ORGANISM="Craspedostauros australis, Strain CCMP3328" /LENGTH=295 /DNA_ID=CAMNT_0043780395 /DNA_START=45 /DNA_END=932 /DNA_ORIENTATION=-
MSEASGNVKNADSGASKCPVDYENRSYWSFLGKGAPAGASKGGNDGSMGASKITRKECSSDSMVQPASLEEAAKHAQTPHPDQQLPLATHRSVSSIPRGAIAEAVGNVNVDNGSSDATASTANSKGPHHQPKDGAIPNWVYPSEQQVFNAMKRKGWEGVEESSIPSFLQIHNSVNERSWNQLRRWEKHPESVRLVRFEGRPKDITPKAWLLSTLGLRSAPFDRHDWYIDNGVDDAKRYVLDFYMEESRATGMPRVDIDVRPALDTPKAFVERGQDILRDLFPGITKAVQDWNQSK